MKRSILLALAGIAGAAAAQNTPRPPDPADPKAPAAAIQYRSPFEAYRPFKEPELASWRDVNAEAETLGGHQGHLAKPPAGKTPAGHSQHGGHK